MRTAQSLAKRLFYKLGYSIKRLNEPAGAIGRDVAAAADARSPGSQDLLRAIHAKDPYEGFEFKRYPFDDSGWGGKSPAFAEIINSLDADLHTVIEVGTWKGASALEMARLLRERAAARQAPCGKILCIDTWLGALEFWENQDDETRYKALGLLNGFPSVYYQFLANVCHAGYQDIVIPFPQTSVNAARWLLAHRVSAGLIYVDGSHEEEDVYMDLSYYWDILAPGGILFGDDWAWDGVRMAAQKFARLVKADIELIEDKWLIRKK